MESTLPAVECARARPVSRIAAASFALSIAVVAAAFDFASGFIARDNRPPDARALLAPAAALGAVALIAFVVAWWCALAPLARMRSWNPWALLVGSYVGIGTFAVLPAAALVLGPRAEGLHMRRAALASACLAFAAGWVAARLNAGACGESALRRFASAAAVSALLVTGALWLERFVFPAWSVVGAVLLPASLVASALLVGLALRNRYVPRTIAPLAVLVLLAGIAPWALAPWNGVIDRTPAVGGRSNGGTPLHVILIVVDTLRADSLRRTPQSDTPNIDALLDQSVVFDGARASAPWTLPSVASIMTGTSPELHGLRHIGDALPEGLPTLPELLQAEGFVTAGIGTNSVLLPGAGFERGFDHYDFHPRLHRETALGTSVLARLGVRPLGVVDAAGLTDRACEWLGRNAGHKTFLWLHFYDPHYVYDPPAEFRPPGKPAHVADGGYFDPKEVRAGHLVADAEKRQRVRAFYDGEVRFLDAQLGRLFAYLQKNEMYQNTLIVLTADHGEEFWEHDSVEHGHSEYDELLRVPLAIRLPHSSLHMRDTTAVGNASIAETVLGLCGAKGRSAEYREPSLIVMGEYEPTLRPSGRSFSTALLFYEDRSAVVFDRWKYIRLAVSGREELYDLHADPHETHSLHTTYLEHVAEGRAKLEEQRASAAAWREKLQLRAARASAAAADNAQDLRALGYVK